MAVPAAKKALKQSGINRNEVDMVLFCGIERDFSEPATAHIIQKKLGLSAKYAFDISNACFGFMDGIYLASNLIDNGTINFALIVTGEVPTKVLNKVVGDMKKGISLKEVKKIIGALSVGDAGGAVILGRSHDNSGFDFFNYISNSQHAKKCFYGFDQQGNMIGEMIMDRISAVMLKHHANLIEDTLKQCGWKEFDWMLSHQIGRRPFDRISKMPGVKPRKMIKTYDRLGNITTATFPVSFNKLSKNVKVKSGDRIGGAFAGSGMAIGQFGYYF